ncbi:DUF2484 family protein [Aestuariicoccus sp. MJ-SS9]|nr:DUF2484 family protein [Aestuariicoccus sp. MJ-SS9]
MALFAGCLWVLAATLVAFLPMRRQYVPGVALLILAPGVIGWIGLAHGWLPGALALAAFLSMFRNPLRYFWARARGRTPEVPK